MKIVHFIAGAGPMYCGSCLHGAALAAALGKAGAEVTLAPLYTPVRTDDENVSIRHLLLGGINVYLDEAWPRWRRTPAWLRRLVDRPWLVSLAARSGGGTRPEQLGRVAVAMFRGDDGPMQQDVAQLLDWLEAESRPDVVHLSNAMLAGLARPLRERFGAAVVATLSGEDSFLEKLPPPYYAQARAELRARAADLDGLVALSRDYADFMADYLGYPRARIEVVRPGLNLEGFPASGGQQQERAIKTAGFFSRICPDKGLHLLTAAMHALEQSPGAPRFRLRAAGYLDRADRGYLRDVRRQAAALGMADRFEYVGETDREGKIAFLRSLDVLCVPSLLRESKGLPLLEAWACGVPVVAPDRGAFSELVADTGGGLLYDPQSEGALAAALGRMLRDDAFARQCGETARQAVRERYTVDREAAEILAMYRRLASR